MIIKLVNLIEEVANKLTARQGVLPEERSNEERSQRPEEDNMSDVIPTQNDIYPVEYPLQVPVEPVRNENPEEPEEIDNRETDTGQNVDTFA